MVSDKEAALSHRLKAKILWLRSTLKQIPLMEEDRQIQRGSRPPPPRSEDSAEVFIVHGHDEGTRDSVKLFVSDLGLKPIILQDQPNEGVSLDRKLEEYSDVDYAIVIPTPDDGGKSTIQRRFGIGVVQKGIGKRESFHPPQRGDQYSFGRWGSRAHLNGSSWRLATEDREGHQGPWY